MGRPSKYPAEFREQAVELVRASDKTIAEIARELQINDTTLGNWVRADQAERGVPDASGLLPLTAAERAELTKLRRENAKLRVEREILKSGGLLRDGVDQVTRFAFVDREKALYAVATLCELLEVSRAGYYAWVARPPSRREVADGVLTAQIQGAFDANRKVYGAPRIHAELCDADVHVGRKRVARLMRAAGIVGCHRRKHKLGTTKQNPNAAAAPDLVDRKFTAIAPNQLWVADVTYVPTVQGWLYLACVTDVYSRMVLGWSMASHHKTDLVVDAVTMAVHRRGGNVPGVIHHSDRGGEYTSHQLERELRRHGALASMGSVADCFDCETATCLLAA